MSFLRRYWVFLLLSFASLHCAQSIFFDDYSHIDLVQYENGQERTPFQNRVAMMPLLRLAHGHPWLDRYARSLEQNTGRQHVQVEPYTAEKLVCYWAAAVSLLAIVGMCAWFGRRHSATLWWICPCLAVMTFYASYAARADANIWNPYDLPHAALFTGSCLAVLFGNWWLLSVLFLADVPMRETAIYIVPCLLAVAYARGTLRRILPLAVVMSLFWALVRLAISHHFAHNPSETGVPYHSTFRAITQPRHWPQLASTFGFLAIPILVNLHRLSRVHKALLVGALPGVLFSAVFGVLYETRVWAEWNGIAACFAFLILLHYLKEPGAVGTTSTGRGLSYE